MRHANIAVFIPHQGCKNDCVFCNQRAITGVGDAQADDGAGELIAQALATVELGAEVEIAFFGGSFTGIGEDRMRRLLDTAAAFVREGRAQSIRFSTRPDYIDDQILDILAQYPIRTVELGVQSLDDVVLAASKRGHTAAQSLEAIAMLKQRGYAVVGQMMLGLPGSMPKSEVQTAETLAQCKVDGARVYPTLVLRGTELAGMYANGRYQPLPLDEAVERALRVREVFDRAGIPVIRLGLHSGESLRSGEMIAGPYHEAFGEKVESRRYYDLICARIGNIATGSNILIRCNSSEVSKIIGHKGENKTKLMARYSAKQIAVKADQTLAKHSIEVDMTS